MNEEIREPKKVEAEDQESEGSSRSPGVTDRGLISSKNFSVKKNTSDSSKNSQTGESLPNDKTV